MKETRIRRDGRMRYKLMIKGEVVVVVLLYLGECGIGYGGKTIINNGHHNNNTQLKCIAHTPRKGKGRWRNGNE